MGLNSFSRPHGSRWHQGLKVVYEYVMTIPQKRFVSQAINLHPFIPHNQLFNVSFASFKFSTLKKE